MNKDAKISKDALLWHFQNLIKGMQDRLNHLEFQLKDSRDIDGTAHKERVEAITKKQRELIATMEDAINEQ